jgi:hypothetical protein
MYACTYETEGSFSRGCALSVIRPALLLTHPLPFVGRFMPVLTPSQQVLPLTTVNVYSLLPYLVLGNKLQGGGIGHPASHRGRLCSILYVDFREFPLWVLHRRNFR